MNKILQSLIFCGVVALTFGQKLVICQVENKDKCIFKSKVISEFDNVTLLADHSASTDGDIKIVEFVTSDIFYVPDSLFKTFPNLTILHMIGQNVNQIRPNTFKYASNLQELSLSKNKIEKLDANIFEGANNLANIRIDSNLITNVSKNAFVNLYNLEVLDINNNNIQSVHSETFRGLTKLKYLKLCCNKLEFLDKSTFSTNLNLYTIFLHSNRINGLSNLMFSHLTNIFYINLKDNACINVLYPNALVQMRTIENDLRMCSVTYIHQENQDILRKISGFNEKIDDNFNYLVKRLNAIENLFAIFIGPKNTNIEKAAAKYLLQLPINLLSEKR